MVRRFLFLICLIGALPFVKRFCYHKTDGFALHKIHSSLPFHPEWEVAPGQDETSVLHALDQPYHYLAKGAQSYVFLSEDGTTVLKFFRLYHLLPPQWLSFLNFPPQFQAAKLNKLLSKQEELEKDFQSYLLAYRQLQEETGLLYVHLNKTDRLKQRLTLYDKLNTAHTVDLDQMEFLVQKRATLVYPAIDALVKERGIEPARQAITALVQLLAYRSQQGIFDKDPDLNTNFGLIGTTPIQIDIGRFRQEECPRSETSYREEIVRITDNFRQWLDVHHPVLSEHLMQEVHGVHF